MIDYLPVKFSASRRAVAAMVELRSLPAHARPLRPNCNGPLAYNFLVQLSTLQRPTISRLVGLSRSSAVPVNLFAAGCPRPWAVCVHGSSFSNWTFRRRFLRDFSRRGEVLTEASACHARRRRLRSRLTFGTISQSTNEVRDSTREEHLEKLEKFYEKNEYLFSEETWGLWGEDQGDTPRPERLEEKFNLSLAAGRCTPISRVLVGGGSPAFVQHLFRASSPSALVVTHYSFAVLASIKEMNDDAVCWHGNIEDLPHSYGPFDCVFLNSLPAIAHSPAYLLQMVGRFCNPGARIVISHCQGKEYLEACKDMNPEIILHSAPDKTGLDMMIKALPLILVEFQDLQDFCLAALEVTAAYRSFDNTTGVDEALNSLPNEKTKSFEGATLYEALIEGSKELGVPTANIDPLELSSSILDLPKGVYFGWAQVRAEGFDNGVHKMVMNIGNRPTFEDNAQVTVEVHILKYYESDFYGEEVRIVVLGFIRDEMRFNSLGADKKADAFTLLNWQFSHNSWIEKLRSQA